jgi:hypothetical protein
LNTSCCIGILKIYDNARLTQYLMKHLQHGTLERGKGHEFMCGKLSAERIEYYSGLLPRNLLMALKKMKPRGRNIVSLYTCRCHLHLLHLLLQECVIAELRHAVVKRLTNLPG